MKINLHWLRNIVVMPHGIWMLLWFVRPVVHRVFSQNKGQCVCPGVLHLRALWEIQCDWGIQTMLEEDIKTETATPSMAPQAFAESNYSGRVFFCYNIYIFLKRTPTFCMLLFFELGFSSFKSLIYLVCWTWVYYTQSVCRVIFGMSDTQTCCSLVL